MNINNYSMIRVLKFLLFAAIVTIETCLTISDKLDAKAASPSVSYCTHVQNVGWQDAVSDGAMSGTEGQSLRLEGICIALNGIDGGVKYTTHVQDYGWQGASENGNIAGTQGESKRLEAIKIYLTGNAANTYNIEYRVHVQDYGWQDWVSNGKEAGTTGESKRLEGIQIRLTPKNSTSYGVNYSTHIQNIGWTGNNQSGEISGSEGQSLRLEGICINLKGIDGRVEYATHIQNIGWQGYVSNGAMSGTSGQSLRLEAIRIKLTGNAANNYDIYYRVHAQNFGWLGWASNGANAGTAGYSYRLEAIQIVVVPKGSSAPGSTANAFKESGQVDSDAMSFEGASGTWDGVMAQNAFVLQNQKRAEAGVAPLEWRDIAYLIARIRVKEAATLYSHTRPDGRDCYSAAEPYGIKWYDYTENLVKGLYTQNGIAMINAWVNSPGHYSTMIEPSYNAGAIACYQYEGWIYCINSLCCISL